MLLSVSQMGVHQQSPFAHRGPGDQVLAVAGTPARGRAHGEGSAAHGSEPSTAGHQATCPGDDTAGADPVSESFPDPMASRPTLLPMYRTSVLRINCFKSLKF